ncbi:transmembrane protein 179B [Eublepharis macularius]|uniref:Transmembrane protein 179B n=1 Tax=Eublepharis macularius TaxID=481883 RepID=A0AA97JYG7_EUBMA|nr:transmembrane protein 179B [Eublepharis macularius]
MAQLSVLLLVELALHASAFLCGIICASALTVTQGEFGGQCILYGSVVYNGTLNLNSSSSVSLCYFVTAISALAAILCFLALLYGIYSCLIGEGEPQHIWVKGSVMLVAVVLFFLLISACILRVGMDTLCASILKSTAAPSCQEAQHRPWVPQYRAERFYDNLYTAEAAAWVNFFFWFILLLRLIVECFSKTSSRNDTQNSERTPIIGDGAFMP